MLEREQWARAEKLLETLRASVGRCTADGKRVAVQLSGGLDSAVVQAIAKSSALYCCTWPDFDNITLARYAACGFEVKPVTFTREELVATVPEVARLTHGKGTWSQVCQWHLANAMAADGIEVVLNGEGSDELLGGYSRYRILYWLDRMYHDPKLAEYQGIVDRVVGTRIEVLTRLLGRDPLCFACRGEFNVPDAAANDERVGLPELIRFERDVAAAHGIEHRHPFMDPEVVSFAHGLPLEDMVDETHCKVVLRRVAVLLGISDHIIDEQTKRGLVIPQSWRPDGEPMWSHGWFDRLMQEHS